MVIEVIKEQILFSSGSSLDETIKNLCQILIVLDDWLLMSKICIFVDHDLIVG